MYDVVGLVVGLFLQFIGIIEPNPNHDSCWLHNWMYFMYDDRNVMVLDKFILEDR